MSQFTFEIFNKLDYMHKQNKTNAEIENFIIDSINQLIQSDDNYQEEVDYFVDYFFSIIGYFEILSLSSFQFLLEKYHNFDIERVFIQTCKGSKIDKLAFLIDHYDINVNNTDAFIEAIQWKNIDVVQFLIDNSDINVNNIQAFIVAIRTGDINIIQLLIENGFNIHQDNDSILTNAILCSNYEKMVRYFLDSGLILKETHLLLCPSNLIMTKIFLEYGFDAEQLAQIYWKHICSAKDPVFEKLKILSRSGVNITESINNFIKNNS